MIESTSTAAESRPVGSAQELIAIVDDSDFALNLLRSRLRRSGFAVTTHSSGKDFLGTYSDSCKAPPDLVLMDILMPEMDGLQVLEQALECGAFPETLFVADSSYLSDGDSRWLGFMGFDAHLPKPTDSSNMVDSLKTLLDDRQRLLAQRNPYKNLFAVLRELSQLRMRSAVLEADYIKKLVSPQVFETLDRDPGSLQPKHLDIAVGFVDIRGFTRMMNRLQVHQVAEILKLFFTQTTELILAHGGFIDKFVGDEVMWFHRKESVQESSGDCIRAGVDIVHAMAPLAEKIRARLHVKVPLEVGVGIACGTAAVGLFGAPEHRIQYSALGPPINLASRLCGQARGGEVLLGGEVIEYSPLPTRQVAFQAIKGFHHDVELHRVVLEDAEVASSLCPDGKQVDRVAAPTYDA